MTKKHILRQIRLKCIDCCGGELREIKHCTRAACALYPFRMGHDPSPTRRASNLPCAARISAKDGD